MDIVAIVLVAALIIAGVAAFIANRNIRVAESNARPLWMRNTLDTAKGQCSKFSNAIQNFISKKLEGSGITYTAYEMMIIWLACIVLPPLLVLLFGQNPLFAVLAAVIGALLPLLQINSKKKSNRKKFEMLLGEAMPLIAANLRGGFTPQASMSAVAKSTSEPLKTELNFIVTTMTLGTPLDEALNQAAVRNKSHDLEIFSAAVAVQSEKGGELAKIVAQVGDTIRERAKLKALVDSKTASAKMQCKVLVVLPIIEVVGLVIASEVARQFYLSVPGFILIGVCALMIAFAVWMVSRMSDIGSL